MTTITLSFSVRKRAPVVMAFAAFSLISPITPSAKEAPVTTKQLPPNQAWSNGACASNIAGSNGADKHDLVSTISDLREEVKILERRQRELLVELDNIKKDQLDQYMYARKHLNFTLRLCTQVERIIEREDSDSCSLEVLQTIGWDILKALERYHAPGTNDPLRFLKQKKIHNAIREDEQTKSARDSPVPSPTAEGDQ